MAQRTLSTPEVPVPSLPCNAELWEQVGSTDSDYSEVAGGVSIYVIATGDVYVTPVRGDDEIVLTAVPAYTVLPFRCSSVNDGTTASLLVIY